jgi:type I restriction enzyme, S subunit
MNFEKIENAFEFIRNGASIKQENGLSGIPITRIETIWNEEIDINRFGYADISDTDVELYKKHLLKNGDLLMTHINSPKHLGKCALYEDEPKILIHGMNLLCLRPNANVSDPKFLRYYFKTKSFKGALSKISNQSVNQASFSAGKLKQVNIPLPPLEEQKQIAAILDAADELRQKDKALIAKYDELTQSLFLDMFGDTLQNPMGWEKRNLETICSHIVDCPHSTPKYVEEVTEFPCIRTTELKNGSIDWAKMKYLNTEAYSERIKRLKPVGGDIVYGREGSYGDAVIIPAGIKLSLGQRVMLFRPIYTIMNSQFMHAVVRSKGVYSQAQRVNAGSTVGHVNIKDIRKFNIIVPPLDLQNQFANRIQSIDSQKAKAQESLDKSEALLNSLLQKAFKGELTN